MPLEKFGFIVCQPGMDAATHRVEMAAPNFVMIALGVNEVDDAPAAAQALKEEGVQLIELCGGFSAAATAAVELALGSDFPVGAVSYGPEAIEPMQKLFG